jgi:hypothetical protein
VEGLFDKAQERCRPEHLYLLDAARDMLGVSLIISRALCVRQRSVERNKRQVQGRRHGETGQSIIWRGLHVGKKRCRGHDLEFIAFD